MSAWSDAIKAGFIEARRVAGVDFVVSGTTYRGVLGDGSSLNDLVSGGFLGDVDATLEHLTADVDPAVGSTLTVGSTTYRVASKRGSADNPVGVLTLQGVNK